MDGKGMWAQDRALKTGRDREGHNWVHTLYCFNTSTFYIFYQSPNEILLQVLDWLIYEPKAKRAVYLGGNSSGMGIWDWNPKVSSKWPREREWLPVWNSILPSFMRSGMNWELWDSSYPGWKCLRQWVAKDVEQGEGCLPNCRSNLPSDSWFASLSVIFWNNML